MSSPIAQFEIHNVTPPLFHFAGHPVAITNSAIYMFVIVTVASLFLVLSTRGRSIIPGRWQMFVESIKNAVAGMVESAAGPKSEPFVPFFISVFIFILFANLIGMIPGTLTVTSHVVVNVALAFMIFAVIVITGFVHHGLHFFKKFVPSGLPFYLVPFIFVVEFISFFIRPLSLSIRLFANMLAGHILLKVFAGMSVSLASAGILSVLGVLPLVFNIAIVAFEFFVALLQAYIFAFLASMYLRDAFELH